MAGAIIAVIAIIAFLLIGLKPLFFSIFTLSFLPRSIGIFRSCKVTSYTIPVIGHTIGILLNFIIACFINIIDCLISLLYWIPVINDLIFMVYNAPNSIQRLVPSFFGSSNLNFITYSVINPVFIIFILLAYGIMKFVPKSKFKYILGSIFLLIGLTFICNLLARTMPGSWYGASKINLYMFKNLYTLPPFLSKLWLYINSALGAFILFSATINTELFKKVKLPTA